MNSASNNGTAPTTNGNRSQNINFNGQSQDTPVHFERATKRNAKLRMGIDGPAGSGKTYTMLKLATELGGPIAVVDTEAQSAEKYADLFEFDVLPLTSFDPRQVPRIIQAAADQGYKVLIIDVLSHFWMGRDGTRQQVDKVKLRLNDNEWRAWGIVDPIYDAMLQAIVTAPLHILIGLRVKTEWIVVDNKPKRVGLKPEMRDGIEYLVDVYGSMDLEHNLIITKSRCDALADQVFHRPGRDVVTTLKGWLAVAKTTEVQKEVVRRRLEELDSPVTAPTRAPQATPTPTKPCASTDTPNRETSAPRPQDRPWKNQAERTQCFAELRERLGETRYYELLDAAGVPNPDLCKSYKALMDLYNQLNQIALKEVA